MPTLPAGTSAYLGGLISIAIGVADAFYVHATGWGPAFDEALVLGGLAAFGIHAAYSSGLNTDPGPRPAPVPPLPKTQLLGPTQPPIQLP